MTNCVSETDNSLGTLLRAVVRAVDQDGGPAGDDPERPQSSVGQEEEVARRVLVELTGGGEETDDAAQSFENEQLDLFVRLYEIAASRQSEQEQEAETTLLGRIQDAFGSDDDATDRAVGSTDISEVTPQDVIGVAVDLNLTEEKVREAVRDVYTDDEKMRKRYSEQISEQMQGPTESPRNTTTPAR